MCGCFVTWFCYHLIAKPGNKTATPLWLDPYTESLTHFDGLVQDRSTCISIANKLEQALSHWFVEEWLLFKKKTISKYTSMTLHKTAVNSSLMHWSYHSLAILIVKWTISILIKTFPEDHTDDQLTNGWGDGLVKSGNIDPYCYKMTIWTRTPRLMIPTPTYLIRGPVTHPLPSRPTRHSLDQWSVTLAVELPLSVQVHDGDLNESTSSTPTHAKVEPGPERGKTQKWTNCNKWQLTPKMLSFKDYKRYIHIVNRILDLAWPK